MPASQGPRDRQPDPVSGFTLDASAPRNPVEALEDPLEIGAVEAFAVVGDGQHRRGAGPYAAHHDPAPRRDGTQGVASTRTTVVAIVAAAALGLTGAGAAGARSVAFDEASRTASTSTADAQLAAILSFNREEERMARDLYRLFSNTYNGAAPFSRIVLSEQRHFEAIGRLLTTYRIPDPSAGRPAGSYADPALQKLYTTWKAQGLISRTEAAKVGVTLEKRDIADLKKSIAATTKTDVKNVLSQLLAASQQHLAAFTAAVNGTTMGGGMEPGPMQGGRGANGPLGQGHRAGSGSDTMVCDGTGPRMQRGRP